MNLSYAKKVEQEREPLDEKRLAADRWGDQIY